ncbi:hypothetical protein SYJ56_01525 [Algoriphagus sp. D3-2-R+10]|uniref:poly(ethylene terephthalate) hydrolase family protein n=1 Tax=Algoriphagus aurantiacus TaxID=3103948 RepID=UPI002B3FB635|nr:hypothetical protein [Algoriphagus sp. D3-2-R+10]MEB2773967.1 hypothetical protein [Algoriphagus sp. D3-2-R+10]
MKKSCKNTFLWIRSKFSQITPGSTAIRGAAIGLIVFTVSLILINSILFSFDIGDPWYLLFGLLTLLASYLLGLLGAWLIKIISLIPRIYRVASIMSVPILFLIVHGQVLLVIGLILISSLLGAAYFIFRKSRFSALKVPKKVIAVLGLLIGFLGLGVAGYYYSLTGLEVDPIENAALISIDKISPILGKSPAEPGEYSVKTITYGSGKDKHRPEFADKVTYNFITDSVNGVAFLDNWKGFSGWWRENYWGFDDKSLPINGRVWYPDGQGPFPLVVVVHGNHSMQDYSDYGYDYLGELLASKGMIMVSADQNFINGSWTDIFKGLQKENDARGWLLLEHLKVWHQWNSKIDHPFFKKVDIDNIALVGHSRGGEAVAHAAMLNELDYYPDDASVRLGYHFNIQSLVAIAPVDGQYEPGDSRTRLQDINYFVIHGAQDADVSSYMGSMQYERIKFQDSSYHFKSGLYVYGANHGQFNTSWGNNDTGNPFLGLLNLKQQLDESTQQEISKVYISAFLESTLQGKMEYLPLFLDARKGKNWLPETIYLNQFEDSNLKILANFDEDFDVSSVSADSGGIQSENLSVWRESEIQLKWQKKGSRAAFLGWNYDVEDSLKDGRAKDVVPDSLIASYSLNLEPSTFLLDSSNVLMFSMAESTEDSNPKSSGKWISNTNDNNKEEDDEAEEENSTDDSETSDNNSEEDSEEKKAEKPLDFTIHLIDSAGQSIEFLLSEYSPLQREISVTIWKSDFIKGDSQSEKVFQTFSFNLEKFAKLNPSFTHTQIKTIKFIFDQSISGVVVVDNIGFSREF